MPFTQSLAVPSHILSHFPPPTPAPVNVTNVKTYFSPSPAFSRFKATNYLLIIQAKSAATACGFVWFCKRSQKMVSQKVVNKNGILLTVAVDFYNTHSYMVN